MRNTCLRLGVCVSRMQESSPDSQSGSFQKIQSESEAGSGKLCV